MAELSASQAAKAAGVSIPTITRAIAKGRLSAKKTDDAQGGKGYLIDTSELFRVFPPKQPVTPETPLQLGSVTPQDTKALEVEVKMLREALEEARTDRDHWRELADRQSRLLTAPAAPAKRRWWPFGRSNDG